MCEKLVNGLKVGDDCVYNGVGNMYICCKLIDINDLSPNCKIKLNDNGQTLTVWGLSLLTLEEAEKELFENAVKTLECLLEVRKLKGD